ncbi:MAG: dTDP-4-dehydrorhamnose 3,5-epimerase [Pirellulaceae bacterium]
MIFQQVQLAGAYVIDLERIQDQRGFFARAWCQREFEEHGLESRLVQCNLSQNHTAGTLRGMHYQVAPHKETKLVRCVKGRIFDVIVDLRPESSTRLQWFGVELSAANHRMLYVPERFAHGYQTLEPDTEVFYQVSEFYSPGSEQGLRWDDGAIGIDWPLAPSIISEKDRNYPDFGA